jgi:hypothetical protein
MKTMKIPGFTAETSLHPASRQYQMARAAAQNGAIRPSFLDRRCFIDCWSTCDCSDLTGSKRGACLRACRAECLADCSRP